MEKPQDWGTELGDNLCSTAINMHKQQEQVVVTVTGHGFRRLDYIDGLRAIGALWVAAGHYPVDPGHLMPSVMKSIWLSFLKMHGMPVWMFLVLSGFCLYYPMAVRSGSSIKPPPYVSFMMRRARRILPPFYAAVALCLGLILFVPFMHNLNPQPVTSWAVIHHVFVIHNLFVGSTHAIDYPVWSIGLEWQLYLMFPLLTWMIWRWGMIPTFVISIFSAILVRVSFKIIPGGISYALVEGPISYCSIMILGMYAAKITALGRCNIPKLILWICFALFSILAAVGIGGAMVTSLTCGIATLCILLLSIDSQGAVHQVLSLKWLSKTGFFSYSIYLLHAPILFVGYHFLQVSELSTESKFLIFWLVLMPLMLILSYLFFSMIEKPFIGKQKKINKKQQVVETTS